MPRFRYLSSVTVTDMPAYGRHHVLTASGASYILDLDAATMLRTKHPLNDRENDSGDMKLIRVIECEIGKPLRLLVQLPMPGLVQSKWRGTPVVSIEEITDAS